MVVFTLPDVDFGSIGSEDSTMSSTSPILEGNSCLFIDSSGSDSGKCELVKLVTLLNFVTARSA